MNYTDASNILGPRDHKKVANNTTLRRLPCSIGRGPVIVLRLHETDILTFRPESVTYDTGGWRTVTTKSRFNQFGPSGVRVYSDKGEWSVYREGEYVGPYEDGFEWSTLPPVLVPVVGIRSLPARRVSTHA